MARPSSYSPRVAFRVCKLIADGWSLRKVTKRRDMPSMSTVMRWLLDEDKKSFWDQYAHARVVQAERMFDEIIEIADDGSNDLMLIEKGDTSYTIENKEVTNRSRLRVDTRKWYLSKVLPKKFGDKIDITSDGKALPAPIMGGTSLEPPRIHADIIDVNEIPDNHRLQENSSAAKTH